MDSGDLALLMPMVGLALGSTFGTMDRIMPFPFTILSLLAVVLVIFKGMSSIAFGVYGLAWGSVFAAMADLIGLDFVILLWMAFFFVLLNGNPNSQTNNGANPTRFLLIPLTLITIGGIIYDAFPDFQNTTGNGFASNWLGCQTSCAISPINLIGSTIFAPLFTGNLYGFISGLFTNVQGISTIIPFISSIIFLFLGLGISESSTLFGVSIDDSASRVCLSLGIAMALFGGVNATFGGYVNVLSAGFGLNALLPLALGTVCFYGAYLQGKDIVSAS